MSYQNKINKCFSIGDLRNLAKARLPKVIFDYIDGGAEDEATLNRNSSGFNNYQLLPETLVDVSSVDLSTKVQGLDLDVPFLIAPTGGNRLFHHLGERAIAPVAEKFGTVYSLSSMSTHNIEQAASFTNSPLWYQIYVWKDRAVVKEFIQRCKASGYHALCLTVDVPEFGQRERDLRNGMTIPPKFTTSSLFDMALHPNWWWNTLTHPPITLANVVDKAGAGLNSATALGQYFQEQLDPSVTWDDMAWMIEEWGGPFLIKGILSPEDAKRAIDTGVSGLIISNHGGRQLDYSAAPIDMLPEIVDAVEGRADIILDGGIRRGTDILKALALGANACMIGRAYLYGLGAGGQAGVERALSLLKSEVERSMKLLGCTKIENLSAKHLRKFK